MDLVKLCILNLMLLISNRVINYINNLEEGWVALWANKYYFPESSIQVICNDQFDKF